MKDLARIDDVNALGGERKCFAEPLEWHDRVQAKTGDCAPAHDRGRVGIKRVDDAGAGISERKGRYPSARAEIEDGPGEPVAEYRPYLSELRGEAKRSAASRVSSPR